MRKIIQRVDTNLAPQMAGSGCKPIKHIQSFLAFLTSNHQRSGDFEANRSCAIATMNGTRNGPNAAVPAGPIE
jgi:hypothetical protein